MDLLFFFFSNLLTQLFKSVLVYSMVFPISSHMRFQPMGLFSLDVALQQQLLKVVMSVDVVKLGFITELSCVHYVSLRIYFHVFFFLLFILVHVSDPHKSIDHT